MQTQSRQSWNGNKDIRKKLYFTEYWCGGLNEKCPQRFKYWNLDFSWCHCLRRGVQLCLKKYVLAPLPDYYFYFVYRSSCDLFASQTICCCISPTTIDSPSRCASQKYCFFYKLPWSWYFSFYKCKWFFAVYKPPNLWQFVTEVQIN